MHRLVIAIFGSGLLATAAMAQPAPDKTPPPPAAKELLYQGQATSILGRMVRDPDGKQVGRIVDLLVDDTGTPRAAVIDFGGFLGVGNRRVAVAWQALRFVTTAAQQSITLNMTEDQISAMPDFKRPVTPDAPPITVAVPPRPAATPPASEAPVVTPVAKP